jgi:hypothetical protein
MSALPNGLKVYIEYKDVRLNATVNQTPKGLRFNLVDRRAITAWHLIGYFRKHCVPGMTCADPMLWICIRCGFCQDFTLYSVLRQSYLKNSMAMLGSEELDDETDDESDDEESDSDTDSVPESWLDDDVSLTSEEEYQLLHEDD